LFVVIITCPNKEQRGCHGKKVTRIIFLITFNNLILKGFFIKKILLIMNQYLFFITPILPKWQKIIPFAGLNRNFVKIRQREAKIF